jgi:hypothetical protein
LGKGDGCEDGEPHVVSVERPADVTETTRHDEVRLGEEQERPEGDHGDGEKDDRREYDPAVEERFAHEQDPRPDKALEQHEDRLGEACRADRGATTGTLVSGLAWCASSQKRRPLAARGTAQGPFQDLGG